ncbi:50S ribosomal protein L21 [Zobellia galactanivorans]|uniref:Large ribosomal subunit protein bL21 n=1 Tax=Zobellia galactanivorans (strain DSM 12802 / CCUG 47099 / CIP 106680 / NCIMB 13871 / Dsij) TaxID=63186 RepID=G0L3R5_ZOBGA|nr:MULTISPECIES: 50S ribosomal protein L21 [Zobellia]MBU3028108.1 50S ribosomal protein L21 [Zobellia galactanivorans]MDO6515817.1 50S ribosomal protein L21 [Zobellia uliginosa]MDO6808389.1 50S ribosomal protein L21 [Zobellia galactanivorans]OWW26473.1 50S ribosomal protein L21 [Zobellia sp. OII3]CAZ95415.1 Ribosomal protein L21 [Zobellia galactanivorans]
MYAIVEMAGQQFKVAKDQKVYVHRLQAEEGKKVTFDNVLLLADGSDITVGAPAIDGAAVEAKVVKHLRGDKVIVFKKKRRKGYQVKNGHRQALTEIVIESIVAKGGKKAAAPKKEEKPAKKEAAPKAAPKKAAKADDLKKIEGIGPKIAETLIAAGVSTFAELAKTDAAKISEIIADVRGNHVTDTWPAQAKLAAEGKWDELKKWQDELDGGKA